MTEMMGKTFDFKKNMDFIKKQSDQFQPKLERLVNMDLFVLDNSLRETTVGQLRGHTLENKWAIYEEIKKCGFKYMVVESFSHMTRLGDAFLRELHTKGEDMSHFFAFTEFIEVIDRDKIPQNDIPIGLIKSKELGIRNVIMEIDLMYHRIDYTVFNSQKMCSLLNERLCWIQKNLSKDSLVFINIRDFSDAMKYNQIRVFQLVNYISSLHPDLRPFGILYEELGKYLPDVVGVWTAAVRQEMDDCGWTDGHLLVHVHEQWGLSDSTQIACLENGANGIWAGVCEEGAALGHASSCLTMMNLIRMGNKKVIERYNCKYLREAAQVVTKITTGNDPYSKQPVYGSRSLDVIFGFDPKNKKEFDFSEFLGVKPEIRITTLASPKMFVEKLKEYFGDDGQFTVEIGGNMKAQMLANLHAERKEESQSRVGLALLFDQAGGSLTEHMCKVIEEESLTTVHIDSLISEIKERFNTWDARDGEEDDRVTFDAFYDGFMAPYFGCYRCEDTKLGLKAIDMDEDGMVDWREFALYLKWAGRQYPDSKTADELIDNAFTKGVIPAMLDEVMRMSPTDDAVDSDNDVDNSNDDGVNSNDVGVNSNVDGLNSNDSFELQTDDDTLVRREDFWYKYNLFWIYRFYEIGYTIYSTMVNILTNSIYPGGKE